MTAVIQPMPLPFGFQAKIIDDVPQINGTEEKQMATLEFFTGTGVQIYFVDRDTLMGLISGLTDIKNKMTKKHKLHIAREMPKE